MSVKEYMDMLQIENSKLSKENSQLKEDYNKVIHEATEFESKVYELQERIEKAIEYYEIIDNRNTYVEISELRYLINLLKGDKDERI